MNQNLRQLLVASTDWLAHRGVRVSRVGVATHVNVAGYEIVLRVETPRFRRTVRHLDALLDNERFDNWPRFHERLEAARQRWPHDIEWVRLDVRARFHETPLGGEEHP